ncbi:dTDP-4-dehydrorhamnose 3,5-epimerase [bacterium SCSIO 12741]|nr:dTDP-4-dehydrorhamnose 3,5-epimerase [bacterium SCSIO 12741]
MEILEEPLPGVFLLKPRVFGDHRGHFYEPYNKDTFHKLGITAEFVQDNQSLSTQKGVLRGLHFQNPPYAQGKLVRVLQGAVIDVAVDIRKGSATYGQHFAAELNEENKLLMYVPPGYAHGFVTLAETTLFNYKCTNYYHPESEDGIAWDDPDLGIDWGIDSPILSAKDTQNQAFKDFNSLF